MRRRRKIDGMVTIYRIGQSAGNEPKYVNDKYMVHPHRLRLVYREIYKETGIGL